jgi:hypothetical protein
MPIHDWRSVGDDVFHAFHTGWIAELQRVLNRRVLPEGYYALAESHALGMVSDVLALRSLAMPQNSDGGGPLGATSVAVAPPRTRLTGTAPLLGEQQVARTLVIRSEADSAIVAMVEIVSRGNKKNQRDFDAFLKKLIVALEHGIHFLLIDLQPPTSRDPEGIHVALWEALGQAPPEAIPGKPLTLASYAADRPVRGYIEPTAVGDPMPEMPLFLDPQWYVSVPLEETYGEAFLGLPREFRRVLEATV